MLVTASNAAGAYAAGRAFGRTALAPSIDRGRTWQGVLGGAVASVIATAVVQSAWLPHISAAELAALAAGSAIAGPASAMTRAALARARVARHGPSPGHLLDLLGALVWTSLVVAAVRALVL